MFSATFPKDIQVLAVEYLRPDHIFIQVGRSGSTTDLIKQEFVYVEGEDAKTEVLLDLLKNVAGKTLGIFLFLFVIFSFHSIRLIINFL
jgi:ATP-dependent RNA helicase DDX3X